MIPEKEANELRTGDVVLIAFAYTTNDGQTVIKRRPAVVISDPLNAKLHEIVVLPITSLPPAGSESPCIELLAKSEACKVAGLKTDSMIDCTVVATVPKSLLVSKIGRLPEDLMRQIDNKRNR